MDQALIAVLKEMFREQSEQIRGDFDALRQEMDQRFQQNAVLMRGDLNSLRQEMDQRFQQNAVLMRGDLNSLQQEMDQRFQQNAVLMRGDLNSLRQEMDQRFQENSAQITTSLRAEIAGLEERLTERILHNEIVVEGLRDDIRQVADGVAANTESLERFKTEVHTEFADVRSFFSYHVKRLEEKTARHDEDIAVLQRILKTGTHA